MAEVEPDAGLDECLIYKYNNLFSDLLLHLVAKPKLLKGQRSLTIR